MNQLTKILAQYDIQETTPQELIRESGDNKVYMIGKYNKKILRVSKRSIEDINFECEAIQYLNNGELAVPRWIKTKDGRVYSSTEGIAIAVLFDYLEGHHLNIDEDNLATKEQAYTAGKALGSISKIGKSFISLTPRKRNIFTELERAVKNEDIFKKDFEGGNVFMEEVRQAIKFGYESKSENGLIHNDFRFGNILFKDDNKVSGIIDFDWSCMGPCIKDLALGILEWSSPDGRTEPDFEVFDAFLDGYNSLSSQKISKGKELYSWIMFAALSDTATYFCDRLENPDLKKNISYSYMYKKYQFFKNYN